MKTSSAKSKGRRLCQGFVDILLEQAPTLTPKDLFVTPSGVTGRDIRMSEAAHKIYPFAIEGKNQESLNIWAALEQAETHVEEPGEIPLVVFKRNRSRVYVALEATEFVRLVLGKRQHR